MSKKAAQTIVDEVYESSGISLAAFTYSELQVLSDKLQEFLDTEQDPEELKDPSTYIEDDFSSFEESDGDNEEVSW